MKKPTGTPSVVLRAYVSEIKHPMSLDIFLQVFRTIGEVTKLKCYVKQDVPYCLVQFATMQQAIVAQETLDNRYIYNECNRLNLDFSRRTDLIINPEDVFGIDLTLLSSVSTTPQTGDVPDAGWDKVLPQANVYGGTVVLACEISANANPDELFVLFGCYGDVLRLKFNRVACRALVQYANPMGAENAMQHLQGCVFRSHHMVLFRTSYPVVSIDNDAQHYQTQYVNDVIVRDYSNSKRWRFRGDTNTRNMNNMAPPTDVLHVSNISVKTDKSKLNRLFQGKGYSITQCVLFPDRAPQAGRKARRMALVQLQDVETAVRALIDLHDTPYEGQLLKIAFSHKTCDELNYKNSTGKWPN